MRKLPNSVQARVRSSLERLAAAAATPGRIGGKRVRTIHGAADVFHRLRVGDYRVMYDVHPEDRVLHVLGIVHRGDLERWLRSR
ncbi:MAG: type II toxin-antitoxin system RelE/ParE family toxin [Actinobacteria bacterium]|nr:type II toxin-antitoxin system RelE/ParE family toxin [Actinomycetota bacterium]